MIFEKLPKSCLKHLNNPFNVKIKFCLSTRRKYNQTYNPTYHEQLKTPFCLSFVLLTTLARETKLLGKQFWCLNNALFAVYNIDDKQNSKI